MTKIKICGITQISETAYLNEVQADYAGFILFFPKSRRNVSLEQACSIKKHLLPSIQTVAVTVCPDLSQIQAIESAGFDFIQIHGSINNELLDAITIPVLKAFNVTDLAEFERYHNHPAIAGYVFDASLPGSGKTFDWSLLENIPMDSRLRFLAGGLTPENVSEALHHTSVNAVDTSSGVENDSHTGKSREKILRFVHNVRSLT